MALYCVTVHDLLNLVYIRIGKLGLTNTTVHTIEFDNAIHLRALVFNCAFFTALLRTAFGFFVHCIVSLVCFWFFVVYILKIFYL